MENFLSIAGNRKSEWSVVWVILINQYIVKWLHDTVIEALKPALINSVYVYVYVKVYLSNKKSLALQC